MPEEGFLRRWARVKASGAEAVAEALPAPPAPVASAAATPAATHSGAAAPVDPQRPPPTLADAAGLTHESDFSAFVSPTVDKDVRRLALKKLFADPHFNVPDRLDMYMDDYNKPDPISATMLAALDHARSALRRPEEVQAELARLAQEHAAPAVVETEGDAMLVAQQDAAGMAGPEQEAQQQGADATIVAGAGLPADAGPADEASHTAALVPDHPPATAATGQSADTVALHSPRAHNAEARP
jgi:hypothetical protein